MKKGGGNITTLKERILNSAVELFYKKGFEATGVREIAKKANVSTSMINYHFGSKKGILKEIMEIFFSQMNEFLDNEHIEEKDLEHRLRAAIKSLVFALRKNEKMFKIIMIQIPEDDKELVNLRVENLKKIIFKKVFMNEFKGFDSDIRYDIIGPALSGMIFSHFLLKDLIPQITGATFDDNFYEIYPDYIADIYLYGALKKLI
ncbi:TetR/AcrR family transcriptional regulator [Marinitoga lauensis]|uniref:TetR/AcrR family transcriptional regulator n=1 Tax=Marinitoga lauensis TaxID=2201189 RepID=UPI001404A51B|nr:TetR/AcrR family transcriptional regulator [Marinitoga lauensis]